jgi:hypothetical protein
MLATGSLKATFGCAVLSRGDQCCSVMVSYCRRNIAHGIRPSNLEICATSIPIPAPLQAWACGWTGTSGSVHMQNDLLEMYLKLEPFEVKSVDEIDHGFCYLGIEFTSGSLYRGCHRLCLELHHIICGPSLHEGPHFVSAVVPKRHFVLVTTDVFKALKACKSTCD